MEKGVPGWLKTSKKTKNSKGGVFEICQNGVPGVRGLNLGGFMTRLGEVSRCGLDVI